MPFKFNPTTGNLDLVQDLSGYLPLSGGTLTGTLNTQNLLPSTTATYTLGDATHYYASGYINTLNFNATASISGATAGVLGVTGNTIVIGTQSGSGDSSGIVSIRSSSNNNMRMSMGVSGTSYSWIESVLVGTNLRPLILNPRNGNVGINTTSPTHTLTLPSTSTGIVIYNTADQTTNYERGLISFASNVLTIASSKGGSGTARDIKIDAGTILMGGGLSTYNVYPNADSQWSSGSSGNYWQNTYTDRLYLNSTAYIDGGTAGVLSITGYLNFGGGQANSNFNFYGGFTMGDAKNIVFNTSTGSKIGTATSQKLAFYNSTPVTQRSAASDLGTVLSDLGLRASGTAYPITTSGTVTLTGSTYLGGYSTYLGDARRTTTSSTSNAPDSIDMTRMLGRGFIDSIAAFSGQGDHFYCADLNPDFTVTSSIAVTGLNNLFNGDPASDIEVPIADLATTPWVLTIETTSNITATDVLTLILTGHRLASYNQVFTDWKVETKGSDNNWYTELERTGVSDTIDLVSVPLHVSGNTYPDGTSSYHWIRGIRLTVSGASESSFTPGKLAFSSIQLRNSIPSDKPAKALGALDIRGGTMYGNTIYAPNADLAFSTITGSKIGTATTQKLGFWNAAPVVQPVLASDFAYTITNDTTDRTLDADSTTLDELADFVATMAKDLEDLKNKIKTPGFVGV